ncbi:MAG: TolC family protein [Acidobacteriota bacterium]
MSRVNSRMSAALMAGALIGAGTAMAQPPQVISLAQAVDEALVSNDRLVDHSDVETQASLAVQLARNAFRPKITPNILGSFGQTDISRQTYRVDVTERLTTGTELRLGVGTVSEQIPGVAGQSSRDLHFYDADTTLTVSQPLLRGFGRAVTRRPLTSAELRQADAGRGRTLTEQQVALDVAASYFRVVTQQSFIQAARQSLDRARRLRDASEAKLDAGLVSQLDVLRAQQLVAQSELQLFDAYAAHDDARDELAFLMGRKSGEPFGVHRETPRADEAPIDIDAAIALALANRLDLKRLVDERADADAQVRFSRNQLLPQVDVNFSLTRRTTSPTLGGSFGVGGFRYATFFTIGMPVDRTPQQIEYQRAVLDRDRRERQLATLERRIADEVRRAIRERDRFARLVIAAETRVAIGRQEVEVAQLRYERGLSNNLDVVAAEGGLLAAENQRLLALAESMIARLRLRALLGVFNPRTDIDLRVPGASSPTPSQP